MGWDHVSVESMVKMAAAHGESTWRYHREGRAEVAAHFARAAWSLAQMAFRRTSPLRRKWARERRAAARCSREQMGGRGK
jgi:hypothetical protein